MTQTSETTADTNNSFIVKHLPSLLSAASFLLSLLSVIFMCFLPVFHVDLGEYAPKTDEEKAMILTIAPELEPYADNNFSVNYSFMDYAKDSNKEANLKKALENDDAEAAEAAMQDRGAYSAAISAGSIREYYAAHAEYMAEVESGNTDASAPVYKRYGDYYTTVNEGTVLVFIFLIFMAVVLVIELIVLLRGLAKKVDRSSLRRNGIFVFSILFAAMHLLLIVFCIAGKTGAGAAIVVPLLFALFAIACPVVAAILCKRASKQDPRNAAKPATDPFDSMQNH